MKKFVSAIAIVLLFASLSFAVTPVKLSLWKGLDVPQDDTLRGIEVGLGSYTPDMTGFIFDLLMNKTDDAAGVQMALITITTNMKGLQWGFINVSNQEISGVQLGLLNKADKINGLQFGFINLANDLYGVQIGLINYIGSQTLPYNLPFTIILNFKF
ncbi:MAG: hypothetical protein LBH29_02040 [Elusimicrobiota bacterium]|jgi:hypothetical protein|nr:hypothetical protein [Elusimicrobiota bacterium]